MNSSACSTFKTAAFTSAAFACSAFACSTLNRASQALAQSAAQLSAHASFSVSVVAVALCAAWPLMSNAQGTSARVTEIEVSNGVRKPDTQAVPGSFNRLKVGTVVEFDKRTRSVGEAMSLLLAPMRYRVTNRTVDAAAAASIMRRPLPVSAMDAGVMSIESALLLLIGDENRLVVDHRNRLVAVERTPPESQGLSKGQPRSQPLASLPTGGGLRGGDAHGVGPGVWAGAGSWAGAAAWPRAAVWPVASPLAGNAAGSKPASSKPCN